MDRTFTVTIIESGENDGEVETRVTTLTGDDVKVEFERTASDEVVVEIHGVETVQEHVELRARLLELGITE